MANGQHAEVMWAFYPDWSGHGYATEAVGALIQLVFEQLGARRDFLTYARLATDP
jgi:RimJ/RimL family protein N-acetyltransferase